jgi:uncharacterized protein YacL
MIPIEFFLRWLILQSKRRLRTIISPRDNLLVVLVVSLGLVVGVIISNLTGIGINRTTTTSSVIIIIILKNPFSIPRLDRTTSKEVTTTKTGRTTEKGGQVVTCW